MEIKNRSEIRELFVNNKSSLAKKLIQKHLKYFREYSESDQRYLIAHLINLSMYDKALSLIGDQINLNQLKELSIDKLIIQLYRVRIKSIFFSKESSMKAVEQIINLIETNKNLAPEHRSTLIAALLAILNLVDDLDEKRYMLILKNLYQPPDKVGYNDLFTMYDFLYEEYLHSQNENILKEFANLARKYDLESPLNDFVINSYIISCYSMTGKITPDLIEEFLSKYGDKPPLPYYRPWLDYITAVKHIGYNETDKAEEYLLKALGSDPSAKEQTYLIYYLEYLNSKHITLNDKIFLRCSPQSTIYTIASGNRFGNPSELQDPLPKYVEKPVHIPSPSDCWLISPEQNTIVMKSYHDIAFANNTIDLYAGVMTNENGLTEILTDNRINVLKVLIGCSNIGAHESLLIDYIYNDEVYFYNNAKLRIKNLLHQLKLLNFKISRVKNRYIYLTDENKYNIIFPCDHITRSPVVLSKKISPILDRKTLQTTYQLKPSTADAYLKKWQDEGLIVKDLDGKYGKYKIMI